MKIHFGADYYPEHWPVERWENDAKLMHDMGIQCVRLAEFSWHKMEPEEGSFDFSWLDEAIEILGRYDIKVILGTPTAAPPAWLVAKYPEILPVDRNGIVHGFGGRHHDCQSNTTYRRLCRDMVTAMCEHYRDNEHVIGWQIDNELGNSHDDLCHCDSCRRAFQVWLEKKYGNIDELNVHWGTAFWSQEYNSFEEISTPVVTVTGENPSQMLDWRLFHSDLILDFAKAQADIIRKICPSHFVTHNFMGFSDTVDYYKLGDMLDLACHDQYPLGYWFKDAKMPTFRAAAEVDVVRSYKKKPIWIMEQEAGITGWGSMGRLPKPGQLSELALQSVAHGADCIVFFRWRSCAMGTEQYWHGILPHSGIPGRSYHELSDMTKKMMPIMDEIEGAMPVNDIALVYSYRQEYAFRAQPHNKRLNYHNQLFKYYKGFYDRKLSMDFVSEDDDPAGYRLVIAPLQYLADEKTAEKYEHYVENGGNLVLTMRAGVKDGYNICNSTEMLPGVFKKITGIRIPEYDCIGADDTEIDVCDRDGAAFGKASVWADIIETDTAEAVAIYNGEFYKGSPCITVNSYGKGKCFYVGCEPDDDMMKKLVDKLLLLSSVNVEFTADDDVEITSRTKDGIRYVFVINPADKTADYKEIPGELILGTKKGSLQPFEVHIIKQK